MDLPTGYQLDSHSIAPPTGYVMDSPGGGSDAESPSMLGSAGRGALGMIPLGEQAYAGVDSLVDHQKYSESRDELRKLIQQDIDTNPGSRMAGQAAGVIAPIIATAGLAAPESLAMAAGQGALVGGGFGAGNAIDTLASGGSGVDAAKDVALGAGIGAAGGGLGQAAGKVLGGVSKAFLPSAEEITAGNTAKVFGGNTRDINRMPGKDPVATLNHLRDVAMKSEVNGEPFVGVTDQMSDRLAKAIELNNESGKTIGHAIQSAGVEPMPAQAVIDAVSSSAKKFPSPDEAAQFSSLPERLKAYADSDGRMSFDQLHKLKGDLGDEAFHGQGNEVLKNAYSAISELQESAMEKAGLANKPAFQRAKEQYTLTSRVLPLLKKAVSKDLTGHSRLTIPGAAAVTGHPLVAAGALMKPRLEEMANAAMFKGMGSLPNISPAIAAHAPSVAGAAALQPESKSPTKVPLEHPLMQQYKGMFDKAMANATTPAERDKAIAVTDFTLSQNHPGYSAAKQKAIDEASSASSKPVEAPKMAEGGIVPSAEEKPSVWDTVKAGKPLEGFGSTLQGFQNAVAPAPVEEATKLVVEPKKEYKKPFNNSMEEQLKQFMLESRGE